MAALEGQRALLGDAAADIALSALRAKQPDGGAVQSVKAETETEPPASQLDHVSVLFVDVVGSTAISQRLSPEDIVEVIDTALARFNAEIQVRRGRVLQFTGDGLLAVFGAETADEHSADNAVLAGLAVLAQARTMAPEMAQSLGVAHFNVRAGIDSGQVLLGAGVDAHNSIRGNTVNLAARMEQSAPVGGLRISHSTYRQLRQNFEVEQLAATELKGLAAPVLSYLVLRHVQQAVQGVAPDLVRQPAELIGREAPLARLQQAVQTLHQHQGQTTTAAAVPGAGVRLLTVMGEAGVGKSRLLQALLQWLAKQPQRRVLLSAQAHVQTQQQPFSLLRDLLAQHLNIADKLSAQAAREQLQADLAPLFTDEGDEPVHLMGHLIGLDFRHSRHLRGILDDPLRCAAEAGAPAPSSCAAFWPVSLVLACLCWTICTGPTRRHWTICCIWLISPCPGRFWSLRWPALNCCSPGPVGCRPRLRALNCRRLALPTARP